MRVAAACANAQAIAERFTSHRKLSHVLYPGLPSHPGHATAARQMKGGFGGMLSLRLRDGEAAAKAFTARLRVFKRTIRCAATEVNPDTAARDAEPPRWLRERFGHGDLGVYAEVIEGGRVAVGDALEPLEPED